MKIYEAAQKANFKVYIDERKANRVSDYFHMDRDPSTLEECIDRLFTICAPYGTEIGILELDDGSEDCGVVIYHTTVKAVIH